MNARTALAALLCACALAPAARADAETVEIELSGRLVLADVHRPDAPARAAVVVAHGFMRSRATMTGHAQALSRHGLLAIAPDLPSLTDSRDNGRALGELVARIRAGGFGAPVERVVLVGFSAGGLAALLAAASPGVVGYVGLDAFDRPGGVGREAARKLAVPAVLVHGTPTFCNAYGISAPWSSALPALLEERVVEGASHCDFEWPTDRACTIFCGATDPGRQRVVRETLLSAVERFLARDRAGAPPPARRVNAQSQSEPTGRM